MTPEPRATFTLTLPRLTPVCASLIVLNIAVFVYLRSLPADKALDIIRTYALEPRLYLEGATKLKDYFRFLTSPFLHIGWPHILINMALLYIFGCALEKRVGSSAFLLFYGVCALIATAFHTLLTANPYVLILGASGAIAGIMGGYIFFPRSIKTLAVVFAGLWLFLQVWGMLREYAFDEAGAGIAWLAHIGGFAFGAVLIQLWRLKSAEAGPPQP